MGLRKAGIVAAASASLVVGTLAFPGAAMAAKSVSVTGTIALDGGETLRTAAASSMKYGDSVHFATSTSGRMDPKGYVYVNVVCLQGSNVVYQWSADVDFDFPLVDQAGQGLEWDGGAAECISSLVYRIDGRKPTIAYLDQVTFGVA